MQSDNIKDASRYVVNQLHHGGIAPGSRAEMWRDVFLDDGAIVKGSIFGNNLTVLNCGVEVEQSVYVRGELKVNLKKGKNSSDVYFRSTVTSPDSLVVEGNEGRLHFDSDLYINKINLENAVVYGNLYCETGILKKCIVLGGVYCRKKLSIENSIVYTFDAGSIELKNNVSLLSPFGITDKPFKLTYPVKALTFFGLDEKYSKQSLVVALDDDDVFELMPSAMDKADAVEKPGESKYILSIVERVLNTTEIMQAFEYNKKVITLLALGKHLDPGYKTQLKAFKKEEIENKLWEIVEKNIAPTNEAKRRKLIDVIELMKV